MDYVKIDDNFVEVFGDAEEHYKNHNLELDKAYYHDGYCYIFGGGISPDEGVLPGHFYVNNKKLVYVPADDYDQSSINNILTLEMILEQVSSKENLKEDPDIEQALVDLSIFAPPIREIDGPLDRIVKMALADLKIDIRAYEKEIKACGFGLNALKSSLTKSAPLTIKNFMRWCAVFGWTCEITLKNTEDSPNPHKLSKEICYKIE